MDRRNTRRRREGNTHISLRAIQHYLLHGSYPNGSSTLDKRAIRKRAESFKIDDGKELFYIVKPKKLDDEPPDPNPGADRNNYRKAVYTPREQLTLTAHLHVNAKGVHMGTERTLNALTAKYYWVGMSTTVRKVIKNCAVCLANRPMTIMPQITETPETSVQEGDLQDNNESNIVSVTETEGETSQEELTYIVKTEVENPPEEDPALDFDPSFILREENNMMSTDEILSVHHFWEKVELLIVGISEPSKRKRGSFILVAMDAFSKWPEATVVESVNERNMARFVFQLIARYGVMEQLTLLENNTLHDSSLVWTDVSDNLKMFNVQVCSESHNPYENKVSPYLVSEVGSLKEGISLDIMTSFCICVHASELDIFLLISHVFYDDSWQHVSKTLEQFVRRYPDNWQTCLDFCLMPLRMTVSPKVDYSPAFLLMNRDPKFPATVLPERDSLHREIMLNPSQLQAAIDSMMEGFVSCSSHNMKRERAAVVPSQVPSPRPPPREEADKDYTPGIRRSSRKSKKYHRLAGFDDSSVAAHGEDEARIAHEHADSGQGRTFENNLAIAPKMRKTSESLKSADADDIPTTPDAQKRRKGSNRKVKPGEKLTEGEEILEEVETDLFYLIIKNFLETGTFPPHSPTSFKQAVRNSSQGYAVVNGKLIFHHKRGEKTVPTTLKERVEIMNEIHISKEEHLAKLKVVDGLERRLVFWENMSADVDAFVKACPRCKHGATRKKSSKMKRWRKDWNSDEENEDTSDEELHDGGDVGKASYNDLTIYLKKNVYPKHLSRAELVIFKKKAKNFKLVKGDLQYCPASRAKATTRKVLLTAEERQAALKNAHGGLHLLKSDMITELRKKFFWHGMGREVERFIESCCPLEGGDKDNPDELLPERLKQFQQFFQGQELPCVQPEAVHHIFQPATEVSETIPVETLPDRGPGKSSDVTVQEVKASDSSIAVSLDEATGLLHHDVPPSQPELGVSAGKKSPMTGEATPQPSSLPENVQSDKHKKETLIALGTDVPQDGTEVANVCLLEELQKFENEDLKPLVDSEIRVREITEQVKPKFKTSKITRKKGVKVRCEHCHIIVRGENNYKEHKYKHTGIKPFHCQVCPKAFTSVKGLRMHMRKHTGHKPYLCNICGRGFPRSASLRYHMKTHDKTGVAPIVCDVCERKFTTEHRLLKHKRFKHPSEAPVFKCDQCGRQFTAKRSLKRHLEAHQGIRRYECQHCKRSFFRKEYLNYHLESHFKDNPANGGPLSSKRRMKKRALMQQHQGEKETVVSVMSLDQQGNQEEVFHQLLEVANNQGWAEVEGQTQEGQTLPGVINLDGSIRISDLNDVTEPGTTVVMVEEQASGNNSMKVHHIIVPPSTVQQQQQQQQQQQPPQQQYQQPEIHTHHHQQQQQHPPQEVKHHPILSNAPVNDDQPRMIEVTLPNGQQHTLTLAGTNTLQVGDSSQETVQYHVECLPGETLTEADFQAIQMLAQASVLQQH